MNKTPEEQKEYNLGYKEGEIIGTSYVMQIRAANYTNSESLAEKIAANVFERLNNKTVSQAFVNGFQDAMRSIERMFKDATKALKEVEDEQDT
jgi:hypothetical protein